MPRACKPYRAKTKGKVERPFATSARTSSWPAVPQPRRSQRPARPWLDEVANVRVHATTQRVVARALRRGAAGAPAVAGLRLRAVLHLERRVSHEGMVSVGGNLYSVPDGTRDACWRCTAVADPDPHLRGRRADRRASVLEGRHQGSLLRGHRRLPPPASSRRRAARSCAHAARPARRPSPAGRLRCHRPGVWPPWEAAMAGCRFPARPHPPPHGAAQHAAGAGDPRCHAAQRSSRASSQPWKRSSRCSAKNSPRARRGASRWR